MRTYLSGFALVLTLGLLLSGCGEGSEPDPAADSAGEPAGAGEVLSVAEARTVDSPEAEVRGYVYVGPDGVSRLCAGLAGSFPPQCGDPSITVEGLDLDTLTGAESDQGVTWTGETTLHGELSAGVLTV